MTRRLLLRIGILIAVAAIVTLAGRGTTNCGGNNAALTNVVLIADFARDWAAHSRDHTFRFVAANHEQQNWLATLSENHWCHGARFLVTTDPIVDTISEESLVIVVSDTPYQNIPKQIFGSAPPTYAAAFSDGGHRLISLDELARLDRSRYIALDEIAPPDDK
jgi:hypothetical protein